MKRKKIYIAVLLALMTICAYAQHEHKHKKREMNPEAKKRIESARIALITERLDLSPEVAQKFWPVYNEYSKKKKDLRKGLKEKHKGIDSKTASEKELKEMINQRHEVKKKELELEKEYSEKLLTVISVRQFSALHKAEVDFRDMIRDRVHRNRNREKMKKKETSEEKKGG